MKRWLIVSTVVLVGLAGGPAGGSMMLPVIQEVLYDGPGGDADDVFTELYGPAGMSLDGWTLVGVNGGNGDAYLSISLTGAVIPGDGLLVIATESATGDVLANRDFIANVDWQNGDPDAVQLFGPGDVLRDTLGYGLAQGLSPYETAPAVDVSGGVSLSRDQYATDTDNNSVDFVGGTPTPGTGVIPEPGTVGLLVLGGSVLLRRK